MGGYWIAGLWTPPVTGYFLWALPAIAFVLGRAANQRLKGPSFIRYIGLVLVSEVLLCSRWSENRSATFGGIVEHPGG